MVEWCDCRGKGKWDRQDGWSLDHKSGYWVHNVCRRPSKLVLQSSDPNLTYEYHDGEMRKVITIDWGPTVEEEWSWQ